MTTPTQGEHAQTEALRQILLDPENQPNQYGAQFLMHGPKMAFKIGARQFTLDYEPTEPGEFEFMRDALIDAFSVFTPDVKTAQPAAPQGVAYAELDDAFESWLEDQDVDRLSDGYESWLNSVRSCWDSALRASHGQAPAGATDETWCAYVAGMICTYLKEDAEGTKAKAIAGIIARRLMFLIRPTAQAAPAAGAVAGPSSADELARDLKKAIETATELREQLTLMEEHARGEVWRWQADGTDDLATMGNRMGVLIYASDLRNLIAAVPTPAAQADSVLEDAIAVLRADLKTSAKEIADEYAEDAARWQALPAFFEEYQIDAMKLYRDIDAYLDAARKQGGTHDNH